MSLVSQGHRADTQKDCPAGTARKPNEPRGFTTKIRNGAAKRALHGERVLLVPVELQPAGVGARLLVEYEIVTAVIPAAVER